MHAITFLPDVVAHLAPSVQTMLLAFSLFAIPTLIASMLRSR